MRGVGPGRRAEKGALREGGRPAGRLRKGGRGVPSGGRGGGGSSLPFGGCGGAVLALAQSFCMQDRPFSPPSRRAAVGTRLDRRPRPRPRLPVLGRRCRGCPRAAWRAYGSGAASASCAAVVVQEKCFLKPFLI